MTFRNEYYYLSNMYPCSIRLNIAGQDYRFGSSEAAFQAAKCPARASEFTDIDGYAAKRLGRKVQLVPGWDSMKLDVMHVIVKAKFDQNPELMAKLRTLQCEIVEDNTWNDTYWGRCNGRGQNHLGRILMSVRDNPT